MTATNFSRAALSKRYGRHLAVDDVSFACLSGMVTGFLGPNGAGKSTTMRMIAGPTSPSAGSATVPALDALVDQRPR
jgi:ABC-2 type transport system ATP-binding protein